MYIIFRTTKDISSFYFKISKSSVSALHRNKSASQYVHAKNIIRFINNEYIKEIDDTYVYACTYTNK